MIDTHYRSDHVMGNQGFPDAQIVGHEYTRRMLLTDILAQQTHRFVAIESPARAIDALKQQIAAETAPVVGAQIPDEAARSMTQNEESSALANLCRQPACFGRVSESASRARHGSKGPAGARAR